MPIDYSKYPANWHAFSREIRHIRDKNLCQCTGYCGDSHKEYGVPQARCHAPNRQLIVRDPVEPWRWWPAEEVPVGQLLPKEQKRIQVVLTVAHLCDCAPPYANAGHVVSLCQRCHLRLDRQLHARNATLTRILRRDTTEQLCFWSDGRL